MTRDDLHDTVASLRISRASTRVAIHALIELGQITAIACAHDACQRPSRDFTIGTGRHADAISLDHILPQHLGGSDLPANVRLAHFACNSGWRATHRPPPNPTECPDCGKQFNGDRGVKIHKSRGGCVVCGCGAYVTGYDKVKHARDCVAVA